MTPSPTDYIDIRSRYNLGLIKPNRAIFDFDELANDEVKSTTPKEHKSEFISKWKILENIAKNKLKNNTVNLDKILNY